jgi:subtilisin family serine protease
MAIPNETNYTNGTLWHLHNLAYPGADIHAAGGWNATNSITNVIVAIVDTGVWYTHQDLASNMWVNPGEIAGDSKDNDGDGIKDNIYGVNAYRYPTIAATGDPKDTYGHGTHVAGIIGAVGNNGLGACGVAWRVRLMACRFSNGSSSSTAAAAYCMDFARSKGAKVVNLSFGGSVFSATLFTAVTNMRAAGIILVTAAGNDYGVNNDVSPIYPANFDSDNVIAVAATTHDDSLADYSNYGATNVDLAAPGTDIYSTAYNSNTAYEIGDGTSYATPCVAGAVALMYARFPGMTYRQIINRLIWTTDPVPSLAGKCVSGGRLNIDRALNPMQPTLAITPDFGAGQARLQLQGERYQAYILQATTNLVDWSGILTNNASSDGTLLYTNNMTGESRFYRALLLQ